VILETTSYSFSDTAEPHFTKMPWGQSQAQSFRFYGQCLLLDMWACFKLYCLSIVIYWSVSLSPVSWICIQLISQIVQSKHLQVFTDFFLWSRTHRCYKIPLSTCFPWLYNRKVNVFTHLLTLPCSNSHFYIADLFPTFDQLSLSILAWKDKTRKCLPCVC
jgi:hypothetical protein